MVHCSKEDGDVIPGGPRSSRTVHGEVAREGGTVESASPRIRRGSCLRQCVEEGQQEE